MIRTRRGVPAPVERAVNAALSRGPGYEPTPIGSAFDDNSVRGYYLDFRAKTYSRARDRDDLPATPLIQLAIGWWERHVAGDTGALDQFLRLCEIVEQRAESVGDELRWPIRVPVPKYRLRSPWYSALPQGQAASLFVRAGLATGDDRYAHVALCAVRPLLAGRGSDLVSQTGAGPILEEAPGQPQSHILNGWMTALWGLWDVHLGLDDEEAGRAFQQGVECLREQLPAYDTGWWSLYSLYPHPLRDLAKPIYHRVHVDQLEVFHRLTGESDFKDGTRRWAAYDRPRGRVLALTQKAAFTVADGWRRRRWRAASAAATR